MTADELKAVAAAVAHNKSAKKTYHRRLSLPEILFPVGATVRLVGKAALVYGDRAVVFATSSKSTCVMTPEGRHPHLYPHQCRPLLLDVPRRVLRELWLRFKYRRPG
jgi:hypothetical protein